MKVCPICVTKGHSHLERHLNNTALLRCEICGFVYADIPDERIPNANSRFENNTPHRLGMHPLTLFENMESLLCEEEEYGNTRSKS